MMLLLPVDIAAEYGIDFHGEAGEPMGAITWYSVSWRDVARKHSIVAIVNV